MQGVQPPPPRAKRGVLRTLLLIGMGLMIPCYLFTVGNVALSPWPLYERNRLALAILTPLCLALLLLLRHAAKAACFERHERAVLLGFAAFYFAAQMISAFALRFTPMTDLEQCVSAARRLLDANQPGLSERSLIYLGRNPHNMGVIYLFCAIFRAADLLGADLQPAVHGRPALRRAALQAFGRRAGAGAGVAAVCHLPAVSLLHL